MSRPNSPSEIRPTEEKSVVIHVHPRKGAFNQFFVIERSGDRSILTEKYKAFPGGIRNRTTCVAIDSSIFVYGGIDILNMTGFVDYESDLFSHDTLSGWKVCPSSDYEKGGAFAAFLNGNIYILGGTFHERPSTPWPWGQVYNLSSGEWSALSSPEDTELWEVHAWVVPDEYGRDQLLVYVPGLESLYLYDSESMEWITYDDDFGCILEAGSAVVDDIIYISEKPLVRAYDWVNRRWFSRHVYGLDDILPRIKYSRYIPKVHLLAVGNGKICVLWADEPGSDSLNISYTIFHASASGIKKPSLTAVILTHQVFSIEAFELVNCLALRDGESCNGEDGESSNKEEED